MHQLSIAKGLNRINCQTNTNIFAIKNNHLLRRRIFKATSESVSSLDNYIFKVKSLTTTILERLFPIKAIWNLVIQKELYLEDKTHLIVKPTLAFTHETNLSNYISNTNNSII